MPFYRFRDGLRSFLQDDSLPFADALPETAIQQAFDDEDANFGQNEGDVYTPSLTLWAFLSQILYHGPQRSCRAAVGRVMVLLVTSGSPHCSDDTGAYCRARSKLPVPVLRRLTQEVADGCEARVPEAWLWKKRHVKLIDGTDVSMPDTPSNQADYPQPGTQRAGLGFPLARLVVLMSLATGMVGGMASGPYAGKQTGETALFRTILERLQPGDVLLADRYYCSYFMIALLMERGIDFVARLHQQRSVDFRRGRRLGSGDHIVEWLRPARPAWMDEETYARMPESIRVREVRVNVDQPGFRVESLVIVTTLLDAECYTRDDIAELYHKRWLVELDIRTLKVTLGLDVLSCKTAEMVRRELWTGLLAYNLIRQTMLEAALAAGQSPRHLSFTAALQKIAASWNAILVCDAATGLTLIEVHLNDLAAQRVGDRPNRIEPRAVKRRPKPHRLLTQPRQQARAELLAGAVD